MVKTAGDLTDRTDSTAARVPAWAWVVDRSAATGLALVGVSYLYQYLKKKGFFDKMLVDEDAGP